MQVFSSIVLVSARVFAYHRMCSLTIECVLSLQDVFSSIVLVSAPNP